MNGIEMYDVYFTDCYFLVCRDLFCAFSIKIRHSLSSRPNRLGFRFRTKVAVSVVSCS